MTFLAYNFIHDAGKYEKQLYSNRDKLVVDFYDLYEYNHEYAILLLDKPEQILKELHVEYDPSLLSKVEIFNLVDTTKLRNITSEHHGKLVQVTGVVTSVSIPVSKLQEAVFICPNCKGETCVPQMNHKLITPTKCDNNGCNNRKFKDTDIDLTHSKYINFQTMTLQEDQNELPSGEIPEPLEVHLYGDLVRDVIGGDHVNIVGIITLKETKPGSLNYKRILEANSVVTLNDSPEDVQLSEEDMDRITELSEKPDLEQLLIKSYAPNIYGWEHVKQALLYVQFGGVRKIEEATNVRGDINVILAGDPATAKTQLMIYSQKLAMRGEMSTAGGASLVGLTAALTKEDDRFIVNPGTLALADKGIAFIDEADKMDSAELSKVHQAMEQQFIKIDKGGLHMTLNARCATVVACNPIEGRWNMDKTLPENVKNFPDSFLTRFDLGFIMIDNHDEVFDEKMARRILGLDEDEKRDFISFDLLKKYIIYAKRITPELTEEAKKKILEYYVEIRQQKKDDTTGVRITPRQLEAFPRMMQARARLHLRDEATVEDFETVLELFKIYVNEVYRDPKTGNVDFDIAHQIPASKRSMVKRSWMLMNLMIESGLGEIDPKGKTYVIRNKFEKYMVQNWNIDIIETRDIIKDAERQEYLFSPYLNRLEVGSMGEEVDV